jgi:hypothetical protein
VRNFLNTVELSDLIKSVDRGRETTMETENLTLHNCSEREIVKQLSESLPYVRISVLSQALIVETITKESLIRKNEKSLTLE